MRKKKFVVIGIYGQLYHVRALMFFEGTGWVITGMQEI